MPTLKQIEEQFQSIADIALDYDGYQRTVDLMKLIDELRYMALEGVLMVQEWRKERKKMKQDASNTKDAFTCKHLLPCGMCDKTGKLCSQTVPKRIYMKIEARCKKCGKEYNTVYNPANKEMDWENEIRRFYANSQCGCNGEIEIVRRYPIDERGNEL